MSKNRRSKIPTSVFMPLMVFILLFIVSIVLTHGSMLSVRVLGNMLDQIIPVLIAGCGMVFVIAQGGIDMSVGGMLAITSAVSATVFREMGGTTTAFIVMLILVFTIPAVIGLINGILVAICKVSSFMTTLAMSIALRGLMSYVINVYGQTTVSPIRALNTFPFKLGVLAASLVICFYFLECNTFGRKCKAIGENELAVQSTGIPVKVIKIKAFLYSGLMAAVAALVDLAMIGGSTQSFGNNFELDVMFAIFLGGIAVAGGRTARTVNIVLGAMTVTIIDITLVLCGWSAGEIKQIVEGLVLIAVLFVAQKTNNRAPKAKKE